MLNQAACLQDKKYDFACAIDKTVFTVKSQCTGYLLITVDTFTICPYSYSRVVTENNLYQNDTTFVTLYNFYKLKFTSGENVSKILKKISYNLPDI